MDDVTKKIITWTVFILLIVIICIGVYFFVHNTNLGKLFDNLFGTLAGASLALDKMLAGCNNNGWGNIDPKKCPVLLGGIIAGLLFFVGPLVMKGLRWLSVKSTGSKGSTGKNIDDVAEVKGVDPLVIQSEVAESINESAYENLVETEGKDYADLAVEYAANVKILSKLTDAQENNPQNTREQIENTLKDIKSSAAEMKGDDFDEDKFEQDANDMIEQGGE